MHGTCVNDSKLDDSEVVRVNDGDVLVFGAEVKRGQDTFPACSFLVNLQFIPYQYVPSFI